MTSAPAHCSAGTSPTRSPAASEMASVNAKTRWSTWISAIRGRRSGIRLTSRSTPHRLARNPTAPPTTASTTPSTSTLLKTRARDAPSARWIATSRSRSTARTSSRLEMFEIAISITQTMPAIRKTSAGRMLATRSSASGRTRGVQPRRGGSSSRMLRGQGPGQTIETGAGGLGRHTGSEPRNRGGDEAGAVAGRRERSRLPSRRGPHLDVRFERGAGMTEGAGITPTTS